MLFCEILMLVELSRRTVQNIIPLCKNILVQIWGYKWENEVKNVREFDLNLIFSENPEVLKWNLDQTLAKKIALTSKKRLRFCLSLWNKSCGRTADVSELYVATSVHSVSGILK